MCSDNPDTIIIQTEAVNNISNLVLEEGADSGTVEIEAGVTFLQLAEWLHERNASMGYTLGTYENPRCLIPCGSFIVSSSKFYVRT